MARFWYVNGPCLVQVKGRSDCAIASLSQLGLSEDAIMIEDDIRQRPIQVDAWGGEIPPERQFMNTMSRISMNLVNVDTTVAAVCVQLSKGYPSAAGQAGQAGALMGGNVARFVPGNNYIGLNLTSPVGGIPYRFLYASLVGTPIRISLGTEKSIYRLNWEAIPFSLDPYNSGAGSLNAVVWDNTNDT